MDDNVTYVNSGDYEGNAMKILECRNGRFEYIWHGYYDGGTLVRLYPNRAFGAYSYARDGIKRRAMTLSIFEIKKRGD